MAGCIAGACGFALALFVTPSLRAADPEVHPIVVYDNTATSLNAAHGMGGTLEFGDEIVLEGFEGADHLWLTSFEFSYQSSAGFVESDDKFGLLRFYALNGDPVLPPGSTIPSNRPKDLLTAPIKFALIEEGAYVIVPETLMSFLAPRRLAWTVSFEGLAPGEDIALDLYHPPEVGESGQDFWANESTGWELRVIDGMNTPANFYAKILAIPEPSVLSLGALAGLGLLASRLLARRRS